MLFNHSDPTLWSLCLRAATGKKGNPTDLIKSLWQGFKREILDDTMRFFHEAIRKIKQKLLQRKMRNRRHRRFPLKQANFELLEVYAATSQANLNSLKDEPGYTRWRRKRYPLGMGQRPQPQMALPLYMTSEKKAAAALFEAEANLRHQLSSIKN